MVDVTDGAPPVGSSPFDPPQHFKDVYDHFGDAGMYAAPTAFALPDVADVWPGALRMDEATGILYLCNGSGWKAIGGGLPDRIEVSNSNQIPITATTYADLPSTPVTTTFTLPAACWVEIKAEAWLVAVTNDIRMSINVTGATTVAPATPAHGSVGFVSAPVGSAAASKQIATRTVKLNAGENTVEIQAMRATSGTQTVSYPVLTVKFDRWA